MDTDADAGRTFYGLHDTRKAAIDRAQYTLPRRFERLLEVADATCEIPNIAFEVLGGLRRLLDSAAVGRHSFVELGSLLRRSYVEVFDLFETLHNSLPVNLTIDQR